jgi:predicted ATPase
LDSTRSVEQMGRPPGAGGLAQAQRLDQSPLNVPPLPTWLTSFVGREVEVASVRRLLDPEESTVRLLTLVGTGGVGKTRLGLAVAGSLTDTYVDGVVFVDLAPLHDARLVPATIAHALSLREVGGRSAEDLLLSALRERQILLVLDSFEHMLGARPVVSELLQRCPRLAVLATSRAALRLQGERRFTVAPLGTPSVEADTAVPDIIT